MGRRFWELREVTDERLLEHIRGLVGADRRVTARLLAHLAEVEDRRLHLKNAKPSMFEYCLELGMSEDEAGRRLCAARVAKRFPVVYRMLDEGSLCLSVLCKLKECLTSANHEEVLAGVAGKSYRKAELWLAEKFPRPDVPSRIRKLPETPRVAVLEAPTTVGAADAAPQAPPKTSTAPSSAPSADVSSSRPPDLDGERALVMSSEAVGADAVRLDRGRVEPLRKDRYRVQFTASHELKEKLELAADLMAHRNPTRDLSAIVERALDLLIGQLKKERFALTDRPRRQRPANNGNTVTRATQRAVFERDGVRCSFVDERGRRCNGRAFLERDHVRPKGKGGGSDVSNVRHLCRGHNQWLAEVEYGRDHVERRRGEAAARTATSRLDRPHDEITARTATARLE